MNKLVSSILIITFCAVSVSAGLGSKKTKYVGGTITALKEGVEGISSAKDETNFIFDYKGGQFKIPFDKITELEYGQKAGRRVAVAILVTPLALFSKKRKHYLTIPTQTMQAKSKSVCLSLEKTLCALTSQACKPERERKYSIRMKKREKVRKVINT